MEEKISEGLKGSSIVQIGHGRLGVHLKRHLDAFFCDDVHLINKNDNLKSILNYHDFKYAFLAVPDLEIDSYIQKFPRGIKLIHFSGFYFSSDAVGVHPVQSFSKEGEYNFDEIDFVIDNDLDDLLSNIFKKTFKINPESKKSYHTYLSVTANAAQLLVNQLGKSFAKETGMPEGILKKITIQSLQRELRFGEKSFSGPWTRNEDFKQNEQIEKIKDLNLQDLNKLFQHAMGRYRGECTKI